MPLLTRIGNPEAFNSTELAIAIAEEKGVHLADMSRSERARAVDRAERILQALVREAEIT
jgi:hypothetical protein